MDELIQGFTDWRADLDDVPFDRPAADTETAMAAWDQEQQPTSDVGLLTCFMALCGFLLLVTAANGAGSLLGWW